MKRTLIPVILFLAVGIGILAYSFSLSYSKMQYEKDILLHILNLDDNGELTAEFTFRWKLSSGLKNLIADLRRKIIGNLSVIGIG